jgi:hypothetical protein
MSDLNALVKLDANVEKNLDVLEQFATIDLTSAEKTGKFRDAFLAAAAMSRLRELLTGKAIEYVCALSNSRLGFQTDNYYNRQRNNPYPPEIIRDCTIEAVLRGARLVGNEFNLIAGNAYFTKAFFSRKLLEYPGLTDLQIIYGIPAIQPGGAVIETKATWVLNGKAMSRTEKFAIRVNEGQGADAIRGKAERKTKAQIYWQLTGTRHADGDVSEADAATPVHGTVVEVGEGGPSLDTETAVAKDEPKKREALPPPPVAPAPVATPTEAPAEPARPRRAKRQEAPPVEAAPAAPAVPAAPPAAPPATVSAKAEPVAAATPPADTTKEFIHPDLEDKDDRYKDEQPATRILRYKMDIENNADISSEILTARANYCWANVGEDEAREKLLELIGMKSLADLKKNRTLQTMKALIVASATYLEEKGLFE